MNDLSIEIQTPDERIVLHGQQPESWNDLTTAQALTAIQLVLTQGTPFEKKLAFASLLLKTQDGQPAQQLIERIDEPRALVAIATLADFLFEEDELSPTLTRNPFPVLPCIKILDQECDLYGPADELANINAEELALVFDLFEQYVSTKDQSVADRLIASLWRRGKPETKENLLEQFCGDRRLPYNEASVELRAEAIASLPMSIRNLLMFFIMSCRLHIVKSYPGIFKSADQKRQQSGADFGWWGVFRAIAGDLQRIETLASLNYKNLLAELVWLEEQRIREEMRRIEKESLH